MSGYESLFQEIILKSIPLALVFSYIGGLLTSLTPCVYPLIPVTVAIISSRSINKKNKIRSFLLTLTYICAISSVYSILGVAAALFGKLFGEYSHSNLVYFFIGSLIGFFGLNMLDIINFSVPSFFQKLNFFKNDFLSVFIFGCIAGVTFAPCTTPSLGVLLTYISTSQNWITGILMMFLFALGLSTLLLLLGTFSGVLVILPKSGRWMLFIKKGLGIFMLFLSLYYYSLIFFN